MRHPALSLLAAAVVAGSASAQIPAVPFPPIDPPQDPPRPAPVGGDLLPTSPYSNWLEFSNETSRAFDRSSTSPYVHPDGNVVHLPDLGNNEADMASGDFDLNGFQDVVIVLKERAYRLGERVNLLLMNEGGIFKDKTSALIPGFLDPTRSRDVVVCDVNLDQLPDILVVHTADQNLTMPVEQPQLFLNRGFDPAGGFLGFREVQNWFTSQVNQNELDPRIRPCSLACGDVTGDGWPDVLIGDYSALASSRTTNPWMQSRLLINQGPQIGDPHFVDETDTRLWDTSNEHYFSGKFAVGTDFWDINVDGWKDIVVTFGAIPTRVYYNLGLGVFDDRPQCISGPANPYMHAVGDFDRNGRPDFYLQGDTQDWSRLTYATPAQPPFCLPSTPLHVNLDERRKVLSTQTDGLGGNVKLADLDGDLDLDALVADFETDTDVCTNRLTLLRNDAVVIGGQATRRFKDPNDPSPGPQPWNPRGTFDIEPIRVNTDARIDIVAATCAGLRIFIQK